MGGGKPLDCGEEPLKSTGSALRKTHLIAEREPLKLTGNVPESDLICGPGTIEVNGECGSSRRWSVDKVPFSAEKSVLMLIFVHSSQPEGETISESGHHGFFSHNGSSMYAIDIPLPEGSDITAARGGKVWRVIGSNSGCGDEMCRSRNM